MSLLPSTMIEGKYEILAKIKEGGMGAIYKVRHRLLDEVRVIKVMKPNMEGDEEWEKRFLQEAKMATRLRHPNIDTLYDFTIDAEGIAYIVMEFIDGSNLAEILKKSGAPPVSLTLEIGSQMLKALSYLHRQGFVHRDVSPDNIMLTTDSDGQPLIKLIDLGIAKALQGDQANLTTAGSFLGKIQYTSPEQAGSLPQGETIDGRSDIYSCGVVLYQLLTGQLPFTTESPHAMLAAHLFRPPTEFAQSDPNHRVPDDVRGAVLKMLEKKREDRYSTAEEAARALSELKLRHQTHDDLERTQILLIPSNVSSMPAPEEEEQPSTDRGSTQERFDAQFRLVSTPTPFPKHPVTPLGPAVVGKPPAAPTPETETTPPPATGVRFSREATRVIDTSGFSKAVPAPPAPAPSAPPPPKVQPPPPAKPAPPREAAAPPVFAKPPAPAPTPTGRPAAPVASPSAAPRTASRPMHAGAGRSVRIVLLSGGVTLLLLAVVFWATRPDKPGATESPSSSSPSTVPVSRKTVPATTTASTAAVVAPDPGQLFVDAPCAAELTSIVEARSQKPVPLPLDAATPLLLTLPAGSYRIEAESAACGHVAVPGEVAVLPHQRSEVHLPVRPRGVSVDDLLRVPTS